MTLRAVILANGELGYPEVLRKVIRPDDLIVVADGGLRHARTLGIKPGLLVGDLDSVDPAEAEKLAAEGMEIQRHPARKDQTDLELALAMALERGADRVLIVGALGGRWDMSLANLMLLAATADLPAEVRLSNGEWEFIPLRGDREITIHGRPGRLVSLVPVGGPAVGVTLTGLEYPLNDATLPLGSCWGVSNVLMVETGRIRLKQGLLLIALGPDSDFFSV